MRTGILTLALLCAAASLHAAAPNACQVLTPGDVAAVQGAAFTDARLTETAGNRVAISQCFYQLPSFVQSVSVDVIRGRGAREFWRDEVEKEKGGEEGEESGEVRHVDGIGEEAVWSGNRLAGALYVLQGDAIVRVSVGGSGTADEKLARSAKLARRALRRL